MDNQRLAAFARLIVPFYALVNAFLLSVGYNPMPFSDEEVTAAVNTVVGALGTLYVWWKNNNITREAQEAQMLHDQVKRVKEEITVAKEEEK
ncbi:MAG: SPP1 phage holin family protein [Exiguobacterium sp.]|nr:SPP1 phage holin family protein [Exiguobacterium sp.]MBR3063684.1 SPP1 phage holin family protein [Exiguobacterium sp.]MBR3218161.1 SPP1 phage holin family protein [Exiguobacterium sp.]